MWSLVLPFVAAAWQLQNAVVPCPHARHGSAQATRAHTLAPPAGCRLDNGARQFYCAGRGLVGGATLARAAPILSSPLANGRMAQRDPLKLLG